MKKPSEKNKDPAERKKAKQRYKALHNDVIKKAKKRQYRAKLDKNAVLRAKHMGVYDSIHRYISPVDPMSQ